MAGAVAWYDAARAGLSSEFTDSLRAALDEAVACPERFPVADGDVREAPVPGFPYCAYYRVRRGELVVLAIYHASRDPDGWRGRA